MGNPNHTPIVGAPGHRHMVPRPIQGPLPPIPFLLPRDTSHQSQRLSKILPPTLPTPNPQPDATRRNRCGRTIRISRKITKDQTETPSQPHRKTTGRHRHEPANITSEGDRHTQPGHNGTEGGRTNNHQYLHQSHGTERHSNCTQDPSKTDAEQHTRMNSPYHKLTHQQH